LPIRPKYKFLVIAESLNASYLRHDEQRFVDIYTCQAEEKPRILVLRHPRQYKSDTMTW